MIVAAQAYTDELNKLNRQLVGRIISYKDTPIPEHMFFHNDNLIKFTVDRIGENKPFGYGICQKVTFEIQNDNDYSFTKEDNFRAYMGVGSQAVAFTPKLYFNEVQRDEKTNNLTVTAYDKLYDANNHTVAELNLQTPYTLSSFVSAVATLLGLDGVKYVPTSNQIWSQVYINGGNFSGTETLREALNAAAEITGTIYFIDIGNNTLCFKSLNGAVDELEITKEHYMELTSSSTHTIGQIISTTELGENISTPEAAGDKYYIRDNPFLTALDGTDRASLIEKTLAAVSGLTMVQFDCDWRGNFLLEIGDRLKLSAKDGSTITSYFLNDSLTYNGGFKQVTKWVYEPNDNETPSNPSNLGDALNQVFAKVDKVNRQIDLVVSQTQDATSQMSSLQLDVQSIKATVSRTEQKTENINDNVNELDKAVQTLTTKVEAGITADDVRIEIQKELSDGVDKVTTATGYIFDDTGLTVSKSNSEMSTTITEDGMQVFKGGEAVLTANNKGVDAANLHATTYLIIGTNSRIEDFGNRTACFWIGG